MKAAGNETRIIRDQEGKAWGVFLAGNGCAEHESEISILLSCLNIDDKGVMLEGRSMTEPKKLHTANGQITRKYYLERQKAVKKTSKVSYLALHERDISDPAQRKYQIDRYNLETEITGAWDDRAFKLAAWEDDAKAFLKKLEEAAANSDLTVWTGNTRELINNPFSYVGLIIAITSLMPEEVKAHINDSDAETIRINEAVEATGIKKKIEASKDSLRSWSHGPSYHALAPRWSDSLNTIKRNNEIIKITTKHPVVFYLNPARQKDFNSGWYTVEELEQWLEGKGPVIKKAA